jgi:solute carrier family 6 amino acid transporter-like protein 5/7/9/14
MIVGQFSARATVKMWQMIPALKGIAIGQLVGNAGIATYYCVLIALTLLYMFKSMAAELPWAKCWDIWTETCVNSEIRGIAENRPPNASSSSELYFL